MAIQLAFSTTACPQWTLEQIAQQAKAIGYGGVVLHTRGDTGGTLTSNPTHRGPRDYRDTLGACGIEPVCLATPTILWQRSAAERRQAQDQVRRDLELAAGLGCSSVRIFGPPEVPVPRPFPGANRDERTLLQQIAQAVDPLLDRATELGVQVLFQNSGQLTRAKPWWWLLDAIDHPMVGLYWSPAAAALGGELPSVSVPTLNTRIRLAGVVDVRTSDKCPVPLGEGDARIEQFILRLLGIGYRGYVCVEWDRLAYPTLASAEEYLPAAHARLRGWLDAVAKSIEDAKPKPKPVKAAH